MLRRAVTARSCCEREIPLPNCLSPNARENQTGHRLTSPGAYSCQGFEARGRSLAGCSAPLREHPQFGRSCVARCVLGTLPGHSSRCLIHTFARWLWALGCDTLLEEIPYSCSQSIRRHRQQLTRRSSLSVGHQEMERADGESHKNCVMFKESHCQLQILSPHTPAFLSKRRSAAVCRTWDFVSSGLLDCFTDYEHG